MPTTPNTKIDAVAYADGTLLTSVETVDLPEINFQAETFGQLGMSGAISIPQLMTEEMTATINFKSLHPDDIRAFPPGEAVQLVVRESISDMTEEGVSEYGRKITMRVLNQSRSDDVSERNATEAYSLEVAVHYYKEENDGETIQEIDPVNRVLIYDGQDLLADRRANLGLT